MQRRLAIASVTSACLVAALAAASPAQADTLHWTSSNNCWQTDTGAVTSSFECQWNWAGANGPVRFSYWVSGYGRVDRDVEVTGGSLTFGTCDTGHMYGLTISISDSLSSISDTISPIYCTTAVV